MKTPSPPSDEMTDKALLKIQPQIVIDVAIEIASEMGDDFHAIPYNKAEWIKTRGGDPFRDVNLPFQYDYLRAASAVLKMPQVAEAMRIWRNHGEPPPYEEPAPFGCGIDGQKIVR
jgi:hypothetical protein